MKRLLLVNINTPPQPAPVPAKTFLSFLRVCFFTTVFFTAFHAGAQSTEQQKADYKQAIAQRSAKIVNTLSIADSVKHRKVLSILSEQYFSLNDVQEQNTQALAGIKNQSLDKTGLAAALKDQEEKKSTALARLHNAFIAHLKDNLDEAQLNKVKDGMTYGVFPLTYAAYQDMIPGLTAEQKEKIYAWLKEARELAMDAESSDKKHAVFGKYKGRINNYLSAAGYDMKKEGQAWQQRIKEKQDKKNG